MTNILLLRLLGYRRQEASKMNDLSFEPRNVLTIDLKSFYASVECLDRGLDPFQAPLAVCDPDRGKGTIVLAVSPYLKKLGVPSRCRRYELPKIPGLIQAVPRMQRYLDKSTEVNSIYLRYVDLENLYVYSIDEAFLDVTDFLRAARMSDVEYAKRIIAEVKSQTGLTVCAGIGDNMFTAKAAMDIGAKHSKDLFAKWTREDIPEKLWPVSPLSKMWGIGSRMEKKLNALGLYTVGDIAAFDPHYLVDRFGVIGGEIWLHANGVDRARVKDKIRIRSRCLSVGQQLFKQADKNEIVLLGNEMAREMAVRLAKTYSAAQSVGFWYSSDDGGDFLSLKLHRGIFTSDEWKRAIGSLTGSLPESATAWRLGITAGEIVSRQEIQSDIFTDWEKLERENRLDETLRKIEKAYGENSVVRLSSLLPGSNSMRRAKQIGGHRK